MSYKKLYKTLLLGLILLSPSLVYAQIAAVPSTTPEVSFNTPSEGEVFPVGGEILVDVSALDSNGTIASVDLFVDGTFIRTELTIAYQWGQPPRSSRAAKDQAIFTNLGEGAHQLTAVAVDNDGETSSVDVNFVVSETRVEPPVELLVEGAIVLTDEEVDGDISSDANNPQAFQLERGSSILSGSVVAGDIDYFTVNVPEGSVLSAINLLEYDNESQTVSFLGVQEGTIFTEPPEDPQVDNLLGYLLFGAELLDTNTLQAIGDGPGSQGFTAPLTAGDYTFWLQETSGVPVSYSFELVVSAPIEPPLGNNSPVISFATPADGDEIVAGLPITVVVNASDTDGSINNVRLFVDGTFIRQDNNAPYAWVRGLAWAQDLSVGTHEFRAVTTDNEGATATATISFEVVDDRDPAPPVENSAPVISFAAPADGDEIVAGSAVSVVVNASDSDGNIDNVKFSLDGTFIRQDNRAPYEWDGAEVQGLSVGTHELRAVTTDNEGATAIATISVEVVEDPEPPVIESIDLALGKLNFEETCAGCHGDTGGNVGNSIDPDNCQVADCSGIVELASYIDMFMPFGNAGRCTLVGEGSCAATTAAYILNGFSTETGGGEPPPIVPADEDVQTPLARLTNDEYLNSIKTLLSLPDDSPGINDAKDSLVSESTVRGLTNDSVTQTMTQLTLSGYSTVAIAAADDFLRDKDVEDVLNCSFSRACVEEFSNDLVSKAYRRPINDEDTATISSLFDRIVSLNENAGSSLNDNATQRAAIRAIIQYILVSPEFIFIVERGEPDNNNSTEKRLTNFEIATRMSLFLAGTLPDEELLADASAGLLVDVEVRLDHAERMMNSETSTSQFVTLVSNWLGLDETLTGSSEIETVNNFVENWFTSEGTFSDIYLSPVTVEHVSGIETTEPVGVLGLQGFVASHTIAPTPTFITRGVFVVEQLLCEALPDGVPDDALDAGFLTPVQVFEEHTKQSCATCHAVFDNYGAAFQQFDADSSLYDPTSQDFGTSFDLYDIGDVTQTVSSLDDLGYSMGSSERASSCMTELWYRHSQRRNIDTQGKDNLELGLLKDAWSVSDNKSMKALLRSIVASDYFITLYL